MPKKCRKIKKHLFSYVEGNLGPGRRAVLENHFQACLRCRTQAQELHQLWKELDIWEKKSPLPGLWPALHQRVKDFDIKGLESLPKSVDFNRLLRPAAAVLLLLLGATFGYFLGSYPQEKWPAAYAERSQAAVSEEAYIASYLEDFWDVPQRSLSGFYIISQILPEDRMP